MEYAVVAINMLILAIPVYMIYIGIAKPELESVKRVIAVLDYIEQHPSEYFRMGDSLIKGNLMKADVSFDEKFLFVEKDRAFVSYSKGAYGSSKLKNIVARATAIINKYENGKSI